MPSVIVYSGIISPNHLDPHLVCANRVNHKSLIILKLIFGQALIQRNANDYDGFDYDEHGFYLQVLDVIEIYCQITRTTVKVNNIHIFGNNTNTIKKFRWPSIANLIYSRFYFENIFFSESISHFISEECRFYQCSFDRAERLDILGYNKEEEVYNSIAGDFYKKHTCSYFGNKFYDFCIFGNCSISDTSFRRFIKKDEAYYNITDCYFDEIWISSSYAIDNLKNMDVMPFSMCPIDERPAIGPQKAT